MEQYADKLVSVIIPVFNGAAFITEALASVKDQVYANWECIIVDDGSTDDTANVVKTWIAADERFRYQYQINKGLSAARNTGIRFSKGSFIQFLDADDVILPTKIEKQLACFWGLDTGQLMVSYTDYTTGMSENILKPSAYYRAVQFTSSDHLHELILRWESTLSIPPHCFLFSANFFREQEICFDEELPNHEDFDCWLQIFMLKPRISYVDEKLCIYRITDGSMSKKMRLMGEGFLQVLNNHIQSGKQLPEIRRLLVKKRREVLKGYNRFDRMTFKDKLLSLHHISSYYLKRIFQKTGILTS